MKTEEIYQKVTNTVIELLESVKESDYSAFWNNIAFDRPKNIFKNTNYTGINFLYLLATAQVKKYTTNNWLTFFEIQQLKAKIKKGSKATEVIFYKSVFYDKNNQLIKADSYDQIENKEGVTKRRVLKYYFVFNVADVEGLPTAYYENPKFAETVLTQWEKDSKAEEIILNTGANIEYLAQNRACYNPATDKITLPIREQFIGAEPFYSTAFHELIHWTKKSERCDRKQSENEQEYAFEELVAELGATFICSNLNFERHRMDNVIYIKSWLRALKNDTSFIFKASAQANKAADYILNLNAMKVKQVA
jgi:antirestriction protein ArdC